MQRWLYGNQLAACEITRQQLKEAASVTNPSTSIHKNTPNKSKYRPAIKCYQRPSVVSVQKPIETESINYVHEKGIKKATWSSLRS